MDYINKNIELISLIYQSVDYLKMIHKELTSENNFVEGWKVNYRIIANDANADVINYLIENNINYTIYNDPYPSDFYLNRVYRCWNFSANTSEYDNFCFVNSDMIFSKGWLSNLLKHHQGGVIPCSRLVESGKMPSGKYGVSKYFGNHPKNIDYKFWDMWSAANKEHDTQPGGLFMPCVFEKETFLKSGGYPEGNIFKEGDRLVSGYPNDRPLFMSGDAYFFKRLEVEHGIRHLTIFDSLVYHIQEGEMSE